MTLKNSENNGTEEIGLVTPTPGQHGTLKSAPSFINLFLFRVDKKQSDNDIRYYLTEQEMHNFVVLHVSHGEARAIF